MKTIKAAAISVKNIPGKQDESLANMGTWCEAATRQEAELVLFPELNLCGYITAPVARQLAEPVQGTCTEQVIDLAARYGLTIGFGLIEADGDACYCTHVLVNGTGILGKQRKIHVPTHEQPYRQAGNSIDVFDIGKAKVGITVCRDSFFDEMTRTLYFKGAEIVLMPFTYYNVPRSRFLKESIHGMSIVKACWTNGYYGLVCNSAGDRPANEWEPEGCKFPGWNGIISPWGRVIKFVEEEGNDEAMVVAELDPADLEDRRGHENFLAEELRSELYMFRNSSEEVW